MIRAEDQENHYGRRVSTTTAVGGVVAAVVSSVCCLGPLLLAAVGVGAGATGFWAGTADVMKALLPYRPLFIAAAVGCFAVSFYLVYRRPVVACGSDGVCERPAQHRVTRWLLWTLAGLALAFIMAPYWLGLE
ncbi:MAG: mercuric transporter MerT family protein [Nitrospira sp.]|nr:mercuric transporter MerT family protein [Candidatus Nitrospira inopinata]MCP9453455.1 mercuric transporter MerT family protein [Nitrospira sp.]MCP9464987.1 mercuric transporter MerT family protein [Nitrospira sp.]